jgi:type IV secretory pathway TrbD component
MSTIDDGYEVPIHRSLTEPILLAGMPRNVTLVFWTSAGAIALGAQQLWLGIIAAGLHVAGAALTKRDPYFFDVLRRAIHRGQRRFDP